MDKALERLAHLNERKLRTTYFSNLWFSWQYMGAFDLFASIAYYQPFFVAQTSAPRFHYLLEITWLLQPLYVFKSSWAHFRLASTCVSFWKHLAAELPELELADITIDKRWTIPQHSLRETSSVTKEAQMNFVTGLVRPILEYESVIWDPWTENKSETGDGVVYSRSWRHIGRFWSCHFHCLLSALLCGSNMCTQVLSPVSNLEITRLLQPLYVFKKFQGTFKALCLLLLS